MSAKIQIIVSLFFAIVSLSADASQSFSLDAKLVSCDFDSNGLDATRLIITYKGKPITYRDSSAFNWSMTDEYNQCVDVVNEARSSGANVVVDISSAKIRVE